MKSSRSLKRCLQGRQILCVITGIGAWFVLVLSFPDLIDTLGAIALACLIFHRLSPIGHWFNGLDRISERLARSQSRRRQVRANIQHIRHLRASFRKPDYAELKRKFKPSTPLPLP